MLDRELLAKCRLPLTVFLPDDSLEGAKRAVRAMRLEGARVELQLAISYWLAACDGLLDAVEGDFPIDCCQTEGGHHADTRESTRHSVQHQPRVQDS